MSEQIHGAAERIEEGALGDLELEAEQAEAVQGGVEPISQRPVTPINDGKGLPPIKG